MQKETIINSKAAILYYFNWHLPAYISGVVASDMEVQLNEGKEITLLSCRGILQPCWNNMEARESDCRACRFNQRSNTVFQNPKVKKIFVDDFLSTQELERAFVSSRLMDYHDIESIKDLQYEGMDLGYGALSSYVSYTRINEPLIDDAFREYFDRLLKVELSLVLALKRILAEIQIDELVIYNGRPHDVRPVLLFGGSLGTPVRVLESLVLSETKTLARSYSGVLPQNIAYRTQQIHNVWNEAPMDSEERAKIANLFYQKRRNNVLTQDRVVYTADQQKGLLPNNWDAQKRNIVVFNSSEDEFTSLGRDWDDLSLFDSQLQGVGRIADLLNDDVNAHVFVRIHPNLKDNPYRYHLGLYELEKRYPNVTVIPPESPVSTYALMDHMSVGISFGSSAGIEASASDKPVILLAGCYYYHLDACYVPRGIEELKDLLLQKDLPAKPLLGAQIFGFYMSYPEGYTWRFKYEVKRRKRFGLSLWQTPHMAFLGSKKLYKVLYYAYQKWTAWKQRHLSSRVPQIEIN